MSGHTVNAIRKQREVTSGVHLAFFTFSPSQMPLEMPSQPWPKVCLLSNSKLVTLPVKINQDREERGGKTEELISMC